jgi:hypothetical protein
MKRLGFVDTLSIGVGRMQWNFDPVAGGAAFVFFS